MGVHMRFRRTATAIVLAGSSIFLAACSDPPTRPPTVTNPSLQANVLNGLAVAATTAIPADASDFEVFSTGVAGGSQDLGDMGVGDTGGGSPNLGRRSLLKFDVSGLRSPVAHATLHLTITQSRRDQNPAPGIIDAIAPFTNPGLGDTRVIQVADYGVPDPSDYDAPSIGNDPGTLIAADAEPAAQVSIDVTGAVNQALAASASFVAFRVETSVVTDGDNLNDVWFFASANNVDASIRPSLEVTPLTPQDAIQFLMADVRTLVSEGVLNAGQGAGLLAKLAAAIPSLNRGSTQSACNQLAAFVNQVNGLVRAHQLPVAAGRVLLEAAASVRSQLGCAPSSLAELTIGALAETPANPASGSIITLSGVVSNSGGTAAGPSTVSLCATQFLPGGGSGATCQVFQGPGVPAGGSALVSAAIGTLLPGTYTVTASVDTFNVVPESNEANNQTIGTSFIVVAANSWTTVAPLQTPRGFLATGGVNGLLYAVGGVNAGFFVSTVEAYDPATNSWSTVAPLPTPRTGLAAGVIGGILYAVGGSSTQTVGTVEAYDPVTNSWTAKAAMPTPRYVLGVGAVDGVLYAVGGFDLDGHQWSTVEAYDPSTDTWATKAPLPTPRWNLAVVGVNGVLYALGGTGSGLTALGTVEAYDPATNTWTTLAPMPTPRAGLSVGVVNGIIYAVGGFDNNLATLGAVEAYDPATNTWAARAELPTPRNYLAASVVNGVLYAVGGIDHLNTIVSTVEAYHP